MLEERHASLRSTPKDVHQLAKLIHDILDHLEAVAYRLDACGLERSPERIPEVARMVHGCVEATLNAIETLQRDGVQKPDELTRHCEEINQREIETENRVREMVRDLFANERDPILLIRQKETYATKSRRRPLSYTIKTNSESERNPYEG